MEHGGGPRSTEPPRSTRTSVGALAPTSTSTLRSASPHAATSCGVTRGLAVQCDEGGQHCTRPAVTLVTCDTRITPNTRLSAPRAGRPRAASHRAASTRVMAGSRLRDLLKPVDDLGDDGSTPTSPNTDVPGGGERDFCRYVSAWARGTFNGDIRARLGRFVRDVRSDGHIHYPPAITHFFSPPEPEGLVYLKARGTFQTSATSSSIVVREENLKLGAGSRKRGSQLSRNCAVYRI